MTALPLLLPCSMSHAAASLPHPTDILPWKWRPNRLPSPQHVHQVVLPPFKQLDIPVVSSLQPSPAPSQPHAYQQSVASSSRHPSPQPLPSQHHAPLSHRATTTNHHSLRMSTASWYEAETPAPVVAEKTAEMVCYLWFSSNRDLARAAAMRSKSRSRHSPTFTKLDPAVSVLQFTASLRFTQYIRKILETTQVSQSVIVLSLHYIFRLRQQNCMTAAQEGSEFRVAVIALMLANKFVDDNTYTNKTWSEVAGIELHELNRMEREFLLGIDSRLYVDQGTYDSWLQLLKGLVLAKERERNQWKYIARRRNEGIIQHSPRPQYPPTNTMSSIHPSYRPRSTSPVHSSRPQDTFTFTLPRIQTETMDVDAAHHKFMGKRSALAAFEEVPSVSRPLKRAMMLQTDGLSSVAGPRSAGPAFTSSTTNNTSYTDAFARLSISNGSYVRNDRLQPTTLAASPNTPSQLDDHQILAQPYNIDQRSLNNQPQNLYFYTLSGSPLDASLRYENRKAKLHYAPRQSPVAYASQLLPVPTPLVVQSATASPRDMPLRMAKPVGFGLLSDIPRVFDSRQYYDPVPSHYPVSSPLSNSPAQHSCQRSGDAVPIAHFANAGPPGVQWTATTPIGTSSQVHLGNRRF